MQTPVGGTVLAVRVRMTSTSLHRALAALLVTFVASCGPGASSDDSNTDCIDGKCDDGSGHPVEQDPFKELGDVTTREWEYIVIGSGAGGGPLAANLARQGHSVLLLEAGAETGGKTEYNVPVLHPTATETPDLAWHYFVDHYASKDRQAGDSKDTPEGILYPRGGALGGSTAVNAMITVAPKNRDWDDIAALTGDPTWSAASMRPYYDRVQRWLSVERPDVPVSALFDFSLTSILTGAFKEAAAAGLGGPDVNVNDPLGNLWVMFGFLTRDINQDIMAGTGIGAHMFPLATKQHRRNGTREYLMSTVTDSRRFPLRIKTQAMVTKIDFADAPDADGKWRAIGVEFIDGAHLYSADLRAGEGAATPERFHVRATREVILAAGTFNTPQLLKLSGIGSTEELSQFGIPTKVELPGVGTNLQDRYEVGVVTELSKEFTAFERCTFAADRNDPCYRDWQNGRGAYTSNGGAVALLAKSSPSQPEADLHIFALPGVFKGYYPGYSADANADRRHVSWLVLKGHSQNRGGTVKLRSADPRERPAINFHYFDDGSVDQGEDVNDLTAVVNGIEFVRKIADRSDSVDIRASHTEVWPGRATASREQLGEWVKKEAWGHHASCSAPIGADGDPNAVLDSKFRVRGTTGLRVVDASVFPRIPGTFIVLPIYMVSEKATDTILESLGERRKPGMFP
jgi:choline dehydrogenase